MDLRNYDLKGLSILWDTSVLNPALRLSIEIELKSRISINQGFTIEFLFQHCIMRNHAINVSFIPTSNAYASYGREVTVNILFDDIEKEKLLMRVLKEPNIQTFGQVRAKALLPEKLTIEQIEQLENVGFQTNEILEIL